MTLSESNIKENKGKNTEYRPEVRDGDGEEGIEVLLLKFGDELAKRGDERRLRLEFMGERRRLEGESNKKDLTVAPPWQDSNTERRLFGSVPFASYPLSRASLV